MAAGITGISKPPNFTQRIARSIVMSGAKRSIRKGVLHVTMPDGEVAEIGDDPSMGEARIEIRSPEFFTRVLLHGEIGFGEAYMDGLWVTDELVALLYLAITNREDARPELGRLSFFSKLCNRRRHVSRHNSKDNSKENIHDHYDLGNRFFPLFLDDSMTYSCALFESQDQPLNEAQAAKYREVCEKAGIEKGNRVLEIGTGWGGFALFAAREYGCHVTSISISEEQVALASQRVQEAGLQSQIDVRFQDYRDVTGEFDSIISIEMFEAVGAQYFSTFFKKCDEVLKPGGRMCMQVITVPDRNFPPQRDGVNWLQKYIFPGGVLPSLSAMEQSLQPTSLLMTRIQDIGKHYATTLELWREKFFSNIDAVKAQGFDDRFVNMWEYYLASCEAAFRARSISDVQVVFEKPEGASLGIGVAAGP